MIQWHALADPAGRIAGKGGGDATMYMWSMWWWPHAILHGIDPFSTHLMWVNDSVDLGAVTSTPLPSVLAAPVTLLLGSFSGPVVSFNLMSLLAPVIGAWLAYRLCLYLTGKPGASIFGGWLYGFSTYWLGQQAAGHLNLVFTFAPPALVLVSLKRLDEEISVRQFVLLVTIVVSAQLLCSTEVAFTVTCMGVVCLLCGLIFTDSSTRSRILRLVPAAVGAYLLAAIVCSPFIYHSLTGPELGANVGLGFPADLLSFVIPSALTWVGGDAFASVSITYPAGSIETGTYVGLPAAIMAIGCWIESWARPRTKVIFVTTAVAVIWSLGDTLSVSGHSTIRLPWSWIDGLRFFDQLLPSRIGMYTALGFSVSAALWLARSGSYRTTRWGLALVAVVFLLPAVNSNYPAPFPSQPIYQERYTTPSFFSDGTYRRYIRHGERVLPIPWSYLSESLLWQAQTQGYFRLASGWFGFFPPDYRRDPIFTQLLGLEPTNRSSGSEMRAFLKRHDVGAVIISRGEGGTWPSVMAVLGLRSLTVGGVQFYRVTPQSLR